jgi:DNA-binding NtrC family response regulator
VYVPPLCERPDDIEVLIDELSREAAAHYGLDRIVLSPAALTTMSHYSWPGNVRELQNCVRCLTCLQLMRPIQPADLPLLPKMPSDANPLAAGPQLTPALHTERPMREAKRELVSSFERRYVEAALTKTGGNVSRAAERSGKTRRVFFELMRKYEIDPTTYRTAAKQARGA